MARAGETKEKPVPLDNLKIVTKQQGAKVYVSGLNEYWVKNRMFVMYEPPPQKNIDGCFPMGTKGAWLERMSYFNDDLEWLLKLPQHQFWSQIIYDTSSYAMLLSFLQEAVPFYNLQSFPQDEEMWNCYQKAANLVFTIFHRFITTKESEMEFMTTAFLGDLLYNNFIFSISIILDLCLLYGNENFQALQKMIQKVLELQPKYIEDIKKSVPLFGHALASVAQHFDALSVDDEATLPKKLRPLACKHNEMTLTILEDLVLYALDIAVSLRVFIDVCNAASILFHEQHFELKICSFYDGAIPKMYQKMEVLANKDSTQAQYYDLHHQLRIMRAEILKAFRLILSSCINNTLENVNNLCEADVKSKVDDYLAVLSDCLGEKVFMRDYHSAFKVDLDLDMLYQLYPELDTVKTEFVMEAILSCYDLPVRRVQQMGFHRSSNMLKETEADDKPNNDPRRKVTGVKLDSLISEVKDIFPHLGDGFVEKCLEHFGFTTETVINALLENQLPCELSVLDRELPRIPPEEDDEATDDTVPARLNIFDEDEFDVMTQDYIDPNKVHRGKRNTKFRDLKELIDDKTHRQAFSDVYTKHGLLVETENNEYDDEYDDTYDHLDVSVAEEGDSEKRPFVKPRVLWTKEDVQVSSEEEETEGIEQRSEPPCDSFVQNPEDLRARAEHQRQVRSERRGGHHRNPPQRNKDVAGGPKGKGQEKNVIINRANKTAHKDSRGNHNRRAGAQHKRRMGMLPT